MAARPEKDEFIPTRRSLLSRLKNWDDQESWKEFFDTYWKMLYSVAMRAGFKDSEAQDIVQESIVAVAKKMPGFRYDPSLGSFKSWLMLITRRRIIDHLRRLGREPLRREALDGPVTSTRTGTMERIPDAHAADPIEVIWEDEWQKNILEAAIENVKRTVDAKQFQMFDCYALKGWPVNDVAKNLNATVGQIYTAKSRVAALIREEVARLEKKMI